MSQHKAPTAVTIAPITEKSGFGLWVERYWKIAAVIVVAITAWILYQSRVKAAQQSLRESSWSSLLAVAPEDPNTGILKGSPEELRRISGKLEGTPAASWALYVGALSALEVEDFDSASALLVELKTSHPDHPLAKQTFRLGVAEQPVSVVDHMLARIEARKNFIRDHPSLFDNPALPADAPRVRITTEQGIILVGLYADLAPSHVENFLKLVRDGYYVGTKFHATFQGEYVQGGDPNSKDQDPATWGQGGPDYTLDYESSTLRHFAGVLSAVPVPGVQSKTSGSQFLITTAAVHGLDETYVPFGKVLEGLDVVRKIESAPVADSTFNRPANPVVIQAMEIL